MSAFKILTGKLTGKKLLGRSRCRGEENIRMDLKIGVNTSNWVDSVQNRDFWRTFVNAALKLRVPECDITFHCGETCFFRVNRRK